MPKYKISHKARNFTIINRRPNNANIPHFKDSMTESFGLLFTNSVPYRANRHAFLFILAD